MSTNLIGIFKKLGKLSELRTKNKNSLVESLNEVSTKADKVETSVANVEAGLNYNTIKVTKNDGTSENVLIKIQGGSGEAINVFKTAQQEGDYVAEGATDNFVIDGVDNTKDVTLIYNNLYLVEGTDYTLDKSSGTVTLTFELVADEVVHYIITSTSYEYSELNGLPDLSKYATNEKTDGIASKVDTLNKNLNYFRVYTGFEQLGQTIGSETITGCIANMANFSLAFITVNTSCNASQYPNQYGVLKIFKQQSTRVNAYFSTNDGKREFIAEIIDNAFVRWYEIPTKQYVDQQNELDMRHKSLATGTQIYTATKTGIYLSSNADIVDLPEGWMQGRHCIATFNPNNDLYGFQLLSTYAGSAGLGGNRRLAFRNSITEGSKWMEVATTNKTQLLCTPSPEIKITNSNVVQINNIIYIKLRVTGNFPLNTRVTVATLPISQPTTLDTPLTVSGFHSSGQGVRSSGICCFSGSTIYLTALNDNNGIFDINGVIVL